MGKRSMYLNVLHFQFPVSQIFVVASAKSSSEKGLISIAVISP